MSKVLVLCYSSYAHAGQEVALFSVIANLLHFAMIIVGAKFPANRFSATGRPCFESVVTL